MVLVLGTILAPGRRTVAAALRAMGLDQSPRFVRYHRVLNRDRWSGLAVGRTLLDLLVAAFVPDGPLLIGIDETIERRRGPKIAAKGIYRDAVRSSHAHFVKASGLRWVCLMLLVPIPWAGRTWALPFLTALAPSARYDRDHGRRHKTLTNWAGQLLLVVRRWWPDRPIVPRAAATRPQTLVSECNPITGRPAMDHTPSSSRLGREDGSGEDGIRFGQAYDVPGVGLADDGDTVVVVNDALRSAGGVGTASGVTLGLAIAAGGVLAAAFGAVADYFSLHPALAVLIVLSPITLLITRQLPEPHRASTAAHRT